MVELIYKDVSYAIIGACMAVYKEKGCGFRTGLPRVLGDGTRVAGNLTNASSAETTNLSTFISEIFVSFRVFRGRKIAW